MKEDTFLLFCVIFCGVSLSAGDEEGSIRLADGRDPSEGRVEIFHDGAWGTVCDDNWDMDDAHVVCRQLHFSGATETLGASTFGAGDGNIWVDDLHCTGREINLLHCTFAGWGIHNCGHSEDAAVRCQNDSKLQDAGHEYHFDRNESLSHQLGELFDSGRDCDSNITVMVDNTTTQTVCAHRVILTLNSGLRASQPDFSSLRIDATADCSQHARSFIRYFYTRKLQVTLPSALCILRMAYDWRLTELLNETVNIIGPLLPADPSFQSQSSTYDYAVFTDDKALQDVYVRHLAWNFEALIHSSVWTNLPFALVKALLSRSDLVVKNEAVVLNGLNRWKEAQRSTDIPEDLLKLIRFPMISAEDLHRLNSSQYHAGKLQGFRFHTLPYWALQNEMTDERNLYTPRIYTGSPWSFTFRYFNIEAEKQLKANSVGGRYLYNLTSDFQTPVHNSVSFTYFYVPWKTSLFISEENCKREGLTCPSLPAVNLEYVQRNAGTRLPSQVGHSIGFSNSLVILCEDRYVVHVADFEHVARENLVLVPNSTEQTCPSGLLSYQVVVRPLYKIYWLSLELP